MADSKNQEKSGFSDVRRAARLSIAPMMDWTDRHCRYFSSAAQRGNVLYTEMVTAPALVRGGALHLLDHSPEEHPVALQLGALTRKNWRRPRDWGLRPGMMRSI